VHQVILAHNNCKFLSATEITIVSNPNKNLANSASVDQTNTYILI